MCQLSSTCTDSRFDTLHAYVLLNGSQQILSRSLGQKIRSTSNMLHIHFGIPHACFYGIICPKTPFLYESRSPFHGIRSVGHENRSAVIYMSRRSFWYTTRLGSAQWVTTNFKQVTRSKKQVKFSNDQKGQGYILGMVPEHLVPKTVVYMCIIC